MKAGKEVPLLMQRKPVASLNEYTGKPVMKSAHWAYESAAAAAHELPPDGGTKAALCAAYSAFTNVKTEFANCRFAGPDISLFSNAANASEQGFFLPGLGAFQVAHVAAHAGAVGGGKADV